MAGVCVRCGGEISAARQRRGANYCSNECRDEINRVKYRPGVKRNNISCGSVGAAHELLACAELMKLGFHVFRSMSPACPCDLIAMDDDGTYMVEVTTGYKGVTGYSYPKKPATYRYDWIAVVFHDGTITWLKNKQEFAPAASRPESANRVA